MTYRIFTVNDGVAYWSYHDGSCRCFSQEDARLINAALTYCRDTFQWIEPELETNGPFKVSKEKTLTDLRAEA